MNVKVTTTTVVELNGSRRTAYYANIDLAAFRGLMPEVVDAMLAAEKVGDRIRVDRWHSPELWKRYGELLRRAGRYGFQLVESANGYYVSAKCGKDGRPVQLGQLTGPERLAAEVKLGPLYEVIARRIAERC